MKISTAQKSHSPRKWSRKRRSLKSRKVSQKLHGSEHSQLLVNKEVSILVEARCRTEQVDQKPRDCPNVVDIEVVRDVHDTTAGKDKHIFERWKARVRGRS